MKSQKVEEDVQEQHQMETQEHCLRNYDTFRNRGAYPPDFTRKFLTRTVKPKRQLDCHSCKINT